MTLIVLTQLVMRVIGIYHEDKSLRILIVVSPEGTNLILTTYIPHSERDIFVLDRFNIKTNSRDCCYD